MDISLEEQNKEKSPIFSKDMRIVFVAIGIIVPSLFVGAMMGENLIPSLSGNLGAAAKGVSAPAISSVEISEKTSSTVVVRWETKSAADGRVDYKTPEFEGEGYEFSSELDTRPDTKHEITLTNLEPGTNYSLQVRSVDPAGRLELSGDDNFSTLPSQRGQASICGWDGDNIERTDTVCPTGDGWAKGESWTESCSAVWNRPTTSLAVQECIYQFSDAKTRGSVVLNESWNVTLEPDYTGYVDVLVVSGPSDTDTFLPGAAYAQDGDLQMYALTEAGKYSFRFRPADDYASWTDLLTITARK